MNTVPGAHVGNSASEYPAPEGGALEGEERVQHGGGAGRWGLEWRFIGGKRVFGYVYVTIHLSKYLSI